jgi:hypothetical protein
VAIETVAPSPRVFTTVALSFKQQRKGRRAELQ